MPNEPLRDHLVRTLDWQDAHATFDAAVEGMPPELRGVRPDGLPHSAWELLEHMRLAQLDILEFCRDSDYTEGRWPEDYWPTAPAPEREEAWDESVAAFRADREALKAMAADRDLDLFAPVPRGTGQTFLRELLLVVDHTSYHVGQLVLVRRLLDVWRSA